MSDDSRLELRRFPSWLRPQSGDIAEHGTVAVAMANNPEVIGCIAEAIDRGAARFLLFGPADAMAETASSHGVTFAPPTATMIDVSDPLAASRLAARAAASGEAQVVMKGLVQTSDFIRSILSSELDLVEHGSLLSHVAVFDIPSYPKPLIVTDAAITTDPTPTEKLALIRNAVQVAASLGIAAPRIACVAPVEKVSEKVASTVAAAEVVRRVREGELGKAFSGHIDGPFGLDVALSPEAAVTKGIGGDVAGRADIVLLPGIDAANVLYKALTLFAGGLVAGIVAGARIPVVLTSRADSEESKLASLLLALSASDRG